MTHRAVIPEPDMTPHHLPHHVLQAGAVVATPDVATQWESEASTKWSKGCDVSRVTGGVGELEKFKTVPEAMSDNDFAGYLGPHGFLDNLKSSRTRVSREVSELQAMDGGAIVALVLGIDARRNLHK